MKLNKSFTNYLMYPEISFDPYFRERIYAECGYCERFKKYTFSKTLWPRIFSRINACHSFNCHSCQDSHFCGKLSLKKIDSIKLDKDLKNGVLLYDEKGVSTETTIGRFTFKIKGDQKNGEQDS